MTLDETIKRTEELAELNENQARIYKEQGDTMGYWSYEEDAKEHRQLAKWLKELKAYREDRHSCELCEEDCISREALRQKLQENYDFFVNAYDSFGDMPINDKARVDEIDNFIALVVNAPSVTPSYNSIKTELELCDDCISREAVIKIFGEVHPMDYNTLAYIKNIQNLPSVTPTRPKGKWIHWTDDYKDYVTCSCCGYGEEGEVLLSIKTPFCPICGADMRGETE